MQQIAFQVDREKAWRQSLCNSKTITYLYLCIVLPAILWLCFIVPPMQFPDESRHFVRACQIAQGGWRSEMDVATSRGGGILPEAVANFVRHWMDTEWLRSYEKMRTTRERMDALERDAQAQAPIERRRFVEFPSAGIYPPALYIPQSMSICIARLFSNKVYIWFYSARVANVFCSVLLIFLALRIAPQWQFFLMLPAVIPMSLSQIASISSDAGIIALTILFVALCIRFCTEDNFLIRFGLVFCFLLLVLGKPVHLALGLLLLLAHKRLGWRRAGTFFLVVMAFAGASYVYWSHLVKPFMALAGEGHNQNPSAQMQFISAHPFVFTKVLLVTLIQYGPYFLRGIIGVLGWQILVLPLWAYIAIGGLFITALGVILCNFKKLILSDLALGSLAGVSLVLGILSAGYILWNPPAASAITLIQGRYFLPVLPLLAAIAPPFKQLNRSSRVTLANASLGCMLLSACLTVRILSHYYFPKSMLLGKNVHALFDKSSSHTCPASVEKISDSWLERIITGSTAISRDSQILVTEEDGTILSESDPALIGADLPHIPLPGSSHTEWRTHTWYLNRDTSIQLWLVHGNSACRFGPKLQFKPIAMPDA